MLKKPSFKRHVFRLTCSQQDINLLSQPLQEITMKVLPRIKAITGESSSAIAVNSAPEVRSSCAPEPMERISGSAPTGSVKGERTRFSSTAGSPNLDTGRFFKGASRYPKGKKRFGWALLDKPLPNSERRMIVRSAEPGRNSGEAEQPVEPLDLRGTGPSALPPLMEFHETGQGPDEEEAEVDLMVQLSGMVNCDWRIQDAESTEQISR
jgi:hypothetical protein